jgi:hypothetical protein
VVLSQNFEEDKVDATKGQNSGRKWVRQKAGTRKKGKKAAKKEIELGKRQLVDVVISEGNPEDIIGGEKKRRQDIVMVDIATFEPEVVLDDQRRLAQ